MEFLKVVIGCNRESTIRVSQSPDLYWNFMVVQTTKGNTRTVVPYIKSVCIGSFFVVPCPCHQAARVGCAMHE